MTDHLALVRSHGCIVRAKSDRCYGRIEAHHVRTAANSGMGMKPPDSAAVGLCLHHHRTLHSAGRHTFERTYGVDLAAEAWRLATANSPSACPPELPGRNGNHSRANTHGQTGSFADECSTLSDRPSGGRSEITIEQMGQEAGRGPVGTPKVSFALPPTEHPPMNDNAPTDSTLDVLRERVHLLNADIVRQTQAVQTTTAIRDELVEIIAALTRKQRTPRKARPLDTPPATLDGALAALGQAVANDATRSEEAA